MKTDNYLSLCLEQAAKSPLHYRHGAIVVRGGKVIAHGYNDYKPGFNGGSLKHGKIAKGTLDGDAVKQLKDKLKKKDKQQQDIQQPQRQQSRGSFVPFEGRHGNGGGHSVNQPLSMHSEMMAIYSALLASSTLSFTTFLRGDSHSHSHSHLRLSRKKCSTDECPKRKVIRGYDATIMSHDDDNDDETTTDSIPEHRVMKRKKDYKRSGKMRSSDSVV